MVPYHIDILSSHSFHQEVFPLPHRGSRDKHRRGKAALPGTAMLPNLLLFSAAASSGKWLSDVPKWPKILEVFHTVLVHRGALGDSPLSFPSGTAPPKSTG